MTSSKYFHNCLCLLCSRCIFFINCLCLRLPQSGWLICCLLNHQVMFNSSRPHGLQHTRLSCPSLSPGVCQSSRPLVMTSNHLILHLPLLLPPSIFPSIRVFSNELAVHIRWPKYWSFSFSISPSNDYSGLISFKTEWFDLLAVQGMLKSLLQCQSSEFFGALPSLWSSSHIHI